MAAQKRKMRTFGWVQNPSDFSNLKKVVQIFVPNSQHYQKLKSDLINLIPLQPLADQLRTKLNNDECHFTYSELVGSSKNKQGKAAKTRKEAIADGLIQVSITSQSASTKGKMWTDNWTADGYLRWALSLNFVTLDRDTDVCSVTELGKKFSKTKEKSPEEAKVLIEALLSYPPASRVLEILSQGVNLNKFEIGSQLGFRDESGFTSYSSALMIKWLKSSVGAERKHIKSDVEGTSDKYARMICSWLAKLDLVEINKTKYQLDGKDFSGFQTYSITAKGLHAYKQATGSSKNSVAKKYVTWEFLGTTGKNLAYTRTRRAFILNELQSTQSFSNLCNRLKSQGFNDDETTIRTDIEGLQCIGIRIDFNQNSISLKDRIELIDIPLVGLSSRNIPDRLESIKTALKKATSLPTKFYALIDFAYNGDKNRDFEIYTIDLLTTICSFKGLHLGGGKKPDGIVYDDNYGVIIDTKAYSKGYSKNISQEDEMVRYITDNQRRDAKNNSTQWWIEFDSGLNRFHYAWISSYFINQFPDQLVSTAQRTGVSGSAINVVNLLLMADKFYQNGLNTADLERYFDNTEMDFGATQYMQLYSNINN